MSYRRPRIVTAAGPPDRRGPPPVRAPVSTGGLRPRDYRRRLEGDEPIREVSEFDSVTMVRSEPSPLMGTALHYHDRIRDDLVPKLALGKDDMRREEDVDTHRFLGLLPHTLTPNQSRFEFDLNRPPDTTVSTTPEMAWGMKVWKEPLNQYEREFSQEKWYEFHNMVDCAVEDAIERFGHAVLFDFHAYNYQRKGPTDWRNDGKPVINLGTRHLELDEEGRDIIEGFLEEISQHTVMGEECLVEENGVFYGGFMNRRLAHQYGSKVITLSVEYKKVYMDELTGEVHEEVLADLVRQMDDSIRALADRMGAPIRNKPELPFAPGQG